MTVTCAVAKYGLLTRCDFRGANPREIIPSPSTLKPLLRTGHQGDAVFRVQNQQDLPELAGNSSLPNTNNDNEIT